MAPSEVLRLAAGPAEVTIDAEAGGRLATWTVHGLQLLEGRSVDNGPFGWGSFPMVPFAGRIRHGAFEFDGVGYEMPVNMAPHAIHGTAYNDAWDVLIRGTSWVVIGVRLGPPWPFGGTVTQLIHLRADRLVQQISVHAGDLDMPVSIGWHPWFRRRLERGGELALSVGAFGRHFEKDDEGIPTGRLGPIPPRPWDDCFVGVDPVALDWPGALHIDVHHDCENVVLYDPDHAICVEPQSGPPNGFSLDPNSARVAAGSSLERTVTWRWRLASAVD